MRANRALNTVTLLLTAAAATLLTIAFFSSAWMKFERKDKETGEATSRVGLWDMCACLSISNAFPKSGESNSGDYSYFRDHYSFSGDSGSWHTRESESLELEAPPGWYTASQVMAVFAQTALMITLASLLLPLCMPRHPALVIRIVACVCAAMLILATIGVFSDQFTKSELGNGYDHLLVSADWGLGLAVVALLLAVGTVVVCILDFKTGNEGENPSIELDNIEGNAVQHQRLHDSALALPKGVLEHLARFLILGANAVMAVAISSQAWMGYVVPNPSLSSYTPQYGLWEYCSCNPVYVIYREAAHADLTDGFPAWYTICQFLGSLALAAIFIALIFACISMADACAATKQVNVWLISFLALAGLLTLVSVTLVAVEFPKEKLFKHFKDIFEVDIQIDYGLILNIVSLVVMTAAFSVGTTHAALITRG